MKKTKQELQAENDELRSRLEEAEETLNAIRSGEVDALIVSGKEGEQIYTLTGADRTYRLLLESMSEGAVTLNPDGYIIYCNAFFAQLLRTPPDKLTGTHLLDFVPLSERQHFTSLLAQCERGETQLKTADNGVVPVYLSANMLPSESGQQLTCLIVTDLSEQKRDEKIIADGKLSRLIIQQAAEAIIVCDKNGKIILASNAAHGLCGQNPLYQPFDKLFPLTLAHGKFFTIAHALRRRAAQSSDAGLVRTDGTPFDLSLTSVRLVDKNRKILGCIVTLTDITERKRAETALRESEQRFRTLAEEMPHFVWETNSDGTPLYANKHFYDYTGLTPEQALTGGWLAIQHPDDIPRVEAAWQQALTTCAEYDLETRFREGATGQYRWFQIKGSPVRDAAGRIYRWVGTCTDIHDQKQAEEKLKKSEKLYRAIGESLDYGVWMCEPDGRNIYASESFLKLVGLTQEQCSDFGWGDVLHPDDAERTIAAWKECVRSGGTWDIEHRFRGVDGQWYPILARGVPVRNEQGNIECWAGINLDISNIKQAEEALRESEERLQLALKLSRSFVFEWEPATDHVLRSDSCAQILGLADDEILHDTGQRYFQRVHPDDRERFVRMLGELTPAANTYQTQYRVLCGDGAAKSLEEFARGSFDAGGQLRRLVGITIDITERKQAEEESRHLHTIVAQERDRLLALLNNISDEIWFADTEGRFVLTNQVASAEFFLDASDAVDVRQLAERLEVLRPDGSLRPVEEAPPLRALRGEVVRNQDEMIRTPATGELKYRQVSASPVRDTDGNIIGSVSVVRDVTESKHAEEALQKSEERFAFAMEAAQEGLWDWDRTTGKAYYSPRWKSMLGYAENEIGDGFDEFTSRLHPDDRERVCDSVDKYLKKNELQYSSEFRLRHKDGHYVDIFSRAYSIFDASGAIVRTTGTHMDITERKAIEKTQLFLLQCGTKDGEDFFESLASYLAEILKMDFVCIDKLTGDRLSARTLAMYSDGKFEDTIEYTLKDTPCGDVLDNMVCCISRDVRRLFPKDAALQDLRAESYVGTTLWSARGEPIGLIAVIGRKPLTDTSFAETLLKLVSIRAASELERTQAEEQMIKANKAYKALSLSGQAVITARSESELLREAVRIVHEVCGYSLVWAGFAEHDAAKTVSMAAQAGDADGYLDTVRITWDTSELGCGPTGTAIRTRKPVINHNTRTTPSLAPWRDRQIQQGYLSSAAFPLLAGEEILGALTVYAPTFDAFTDEETRLLMELSSNLAYGIVFMRMDKDRRQAAEILRTSNARLDILSETASQLLKTDSPQQVIERLCRRVMAFLDCQAFFNFLVDEKRGQLHLNACAGIAPEEAAKIEWLDYGIAVCGCAARDGCRIVAEDILNTPDIRTDLVKSYGIQAYACHPLISQGKVIGTLSFGTRTRPHFADDDLSLMKAVADQVSIAMERKQAQSRIAQLNLELQNKLEKIEGEVRRRTLAEEILVKYAEDLARSNEELDSFSVAVSHDLQEPLRSIAGFMRLLEKKYGDLLDSSGREYIERSIASSQRLGAMINSLLSYSRITTRGKEFEHHELDAILKTALENLNASIGQTRALITSEPLPRIYGDPEQLVRVFQNLIGNSIKYCGSRRPEIHISWQRKGDAFIVAVKDNAEGIEPEYLENIFDVFSRVPSQHNIAGTGMGLAVCKKIIARHNGQLWAESEPEKGSTFFFSLPVR